MMNLITTDEDSAVFKKIGKEKYEAALKKEFASTSVLNGNELMWDSKLYITSAERQNSIMEKLKCTICTYIMTNPVQLLACKCRFCDRCIVKTFRNKDIE